MVLDENRYPHIYAVAYILHHGEATEFRVDNCGYTTATLDRIEASLKAMSFAQIVEYTSKIDAPIVPVLAVCHAFMCDNDLAVPNLPPELLRMDEE